MMIQSYDEFCLESYTPRYLFLDTVTEGVMGSIWNKLKETVEKIFNWIAECGRKIANMFKSSPKTNSATQKTENKSDKPKQGKTTPSKKSDDDDTITLSMNYDAKTLSMILKHLEELASGKLRSDVADIIDSLNGDFNFDEVHQKVQGLSEAIEFEKTTKNKWLRGEFNLLILPARGFKENTTDKLSKEFPELRKQITRTIAKKGNTNFNSANKEEDKKTGEISRILSGLLTYIKHLQILVNTVAKDLVTLDGTALTF